MPLFGRRRSGEPPARQREREQEALDIHDNIVQGLAEAQLAFDVGRPDQAREAVDRTLAAARRIMTDLLGEPGEDNALGPGDLRRSAAPGDQPHVRP